MKVGYRNDAPHLKMQGGHAKFKVQTYHSELKIRE